MITRPYVHNYRCLENFELPISGISSSLLIGRNGTGKSTIASALEIFQQIGRGQNRVGKLVSPADFARGQTNLPIRLEIEVTIQSKPYAYTLALELPEQFRELRVL